MRRLLSNRSRANNDSKARQHHAHHNKSEHDSETLIEEHHHHHQHNHAPAVAAPPRRQNIGVFVATTDHPGLHLAAALMAEGSYNVTLIVPDPLDIPPAPEGAHVVRFKPDLPRIQLTHAILGQEILVAAPGFASRINETRVVEAAYAAGVKKILVVECAEGLPSSHRSHPSRSRVASCAIEPKQIQAVRKALGHFRSQESPGAGIGYCILAFGTAAMLLPETPMSIDIDVPVEVCRIPLPSATTATTEEASELTHPELHRIAAGHVAHALRTQEDLFQGKVKLFVLEDSASASTYVPPSNPQVFGGDHASPAIESY